jgi:CIC family chloride channel protein
VINRLEFGGVTEFSLLRGRHAAFYVELPAFLILGLVSGVDRGGVHARDLLGGGHGQQGAAADSVCRAGCARHGGALLGCSRSGFPHIIGVGYETTSAALTGQLLLHEAIIFTISRRRGGDHHRRAHGGRGVFALADAGGAVGAAFGIIATAILPDVSGTRRSMRWRAWGRWRRPCWGRRSRPR